MCFIGFVKSYLFHSFVGMTYIRSANGGEDPYEATNRDPTSPRGRLRDRGTSPILDPNKYIVVDLVEDP